MLEQLGEGQREFRITEKKVNFGACVDPAN